MSRFAFALRAGARSRPRDAWRIVQRALLGFEPGQEHVAVSLRAPQREIRVNLQGLAATHDVTYRHSLASLRPWTVAIGLPNGESERALRSAALTLSFREEQPGTPELGRLDLRFTGAIDAGDDGRIGLFDATRYHNACLSPLRLRLHSLYRRLEIGRRPARGGRMLTAELNRHYVFYICPRPVVLATVGAPELGNLLPLDLYGAISSTRFALAFRTSSPAVRLIREARRLALSRIPFVWKNKVYQLGQQYRQERIDWAQCGFAMVPSPTFALPVPGAALAVRELSIETIEPVGVYTVVVAATAGYHEYTEGPELHHSHELYEYYRRRNRRVRD